MAGNETKTQHGAEATAPRGTAVFFLLVLVAGALLSAIAFASIDHTPGGSALTGEWTATLQGSFEESLPIYEPALQLWTAISYAAFGQGGRGVLVGHDGWLFTEQELTIAESERDRMEESLSFIRTAAASLRERGASLAILLLPAKARVYTDKLPRAALPAAVAARYDMALRRLRDTVPALTVPDLRTAFLEAREDGASVFLRTDTHWTPTGAALAAEALAEGLSGSAAVNRLDTQRFRTRRTETVVHHGDLLRFLPLGPFQESLGPRPDRVSIRETTPESAITDASAADALFADPSIAVTLVGTSYSAGELWNFRGAVAAALETDVLNVAEEGRGPFSPMQDYLESETITDQPPVLVVWEIPERYLVSPP